MHLIQNIAARDAIKARFDAANVSKNMAHGSVFPGSKAINQRMEEGVLTLNMYGSGAVRVMLRQGIIHYYDHTSTLAHEEQATGAQLDWFDRCFTRISAEFK